MVEVTKSDIYHYLNENDKSKYNVIDIIGEIDGVMVGDVGHYGVTCKVTYVEPDTISIKIEEKRCIIVEEVIEQWVRDRNAVTWYE